jgi:alpha-L-rhamnosidase
MVLKINGIGFFWTFILFLFSYSVAIGQTEVVKLVCEYYANPIGIDIEKPRISWQLLSDKENITQSANEIRVANPTC